MKKNDDDKKTALKLLNQYADSYKRIEIENKNLINELNDYKTNLKINKEIISGLFGNMNANDKSNFVMKKLHEEMTIISKKFETARKENEEMKNKINYYENIINESIFKHLENIDILKNRMFILENSIIKKDNMIYNLNLKLNRYMQREELMDISNPREIYILEPNSSVNAVHDELMLYKQVFDSMTHHIRENSQAISKLEKDLYDTRLENCNLKGVDPEEFFAALHKNENNNSQLELNKSKDYSIRTKSTFNRNENYDLKNKYIPNKNIDNDLESNINMHSPMPIHFPEKIKMTNTIEDIKYIMPPLDLTKTKKSNNQNQISNHNNNNTQNTKANTEDTNLNKKRNFDSEIWLENMKNVGLTEEEMERFFKNKFISKLLDAIDNLINIILDNSKQLIQTQQDKSILNNQISILKKDNVSLTQNYLELKEKMKILEEKKKKNAHQNEEEIHERLNSSMVNNTSRVIDSPDSKEIEKHEKLKQYYNDENYEITNRKTALNNSDDHTKRTRVHQNILNTEDNYSNLVNNTDANEVSVIVDINKDDDIFKEINNYKEKSKRNRSNKPKISIDGHNNCYVDDEKNYYIQKIKKNIETKIKTTKLLSPKKTMYNNLQKDNQKNIKVLKKISDNPNISNTKLNKNDFFKNVVTLESLNSNSFNKENMNESCFITQNDNKSISNININIKN